jgi:hypothetical protein
MQSRNLSRITRLSLLFSAVALSSACGGGGGGEAVVVDAPLRPHQAP